MKPKSTIRADWRPRLALALLITGLQALFFAPHYRGLASFPNDFPVAYYAWTAYWQSSVIAGEWPHWMPFQSMGYPFASNPQTGIFYPPFWLFVIFKVPYTLRAANVFQAAHIAVGALGFYLLVRALVRSPWIAVVGGVAFHLFGGLFTNAEHADIVRGYCLLPWLLWTCLLRVPDVEESPEFLPRAPWLARRNLWIPAIVFLFFTGSYPGVALAGIFLAAVFLAAQLAMRAVSSGVRDHRLRSAVVIAAALLGTGMICSSMFLVPLGYLSRFLVRSYPSFADMERTRYFLAPIDLIELAFPTLVVDTIWRPFYGYEGSMLGMQIPVVLLLFLGFLNRDRASRLVPLLATLPFVLIMCVAGAAPLRWLLTTLIPPLARSRFPAGDYRIYLWMILAVGCLYGLDEFLCRTQAARGWRPALPILGAAAGLSLLAWWVDSYAVVSGRQDDFRSVLATQAIAVAGLLILLALRMRFGLPVAVFALLLCGLMSFSVYRMYRVMDFHWSVADAENNVYLRRKLPLYVTGGLAASRIFSQPPGVRPPRIEPGKGDALWRGVLTGEYLTGDWGGAETVWHHRIFANRSMKAYMMRGSELRAWACSRVDCTGQGAIQLGIDEADASLLSFETLNYARNTVTYRVRLRQPSLVVENEIYAPGWTGSARERPVQLREVNGALRGWVLEPGDYELTVQYETPLLPASRLLSLAGIAFWLFVTVYAARPAVSR